MGIITKPYTFASGRVVDGTQINANFDALITGVGDTTTLRPTLASLGAVATDDARLSDARPASDVSAWAKAATKPIYSAAEVSALPLAGGTMTGNIVMPDGGTIGQAAGPLLNFDDANDRLVITGASLRVASETADISTEVISTTNNVGLRLKGGGQSFLWQTKGDSVSKRFLLYDETAGAERLTLLTNGNFGIGETTPLSKLSINGSLSASVQKLQGGYLEPIAHQLELNGQNSGWNAGLLFGSTNGNNRGTYNFEVATGNLYYLVSSDATNFAEVMRIQQNGNVGIGTTAPLSKLSINGGLHVGGDSDAGDDNAYIDGNMSALTITDRTPVYEGDAVAELIKVKGIDGKIDHSTLPAFARHVTTTQVVSETEKDADGKAVMIETQEEGRDLGAMISMMTVAIKQLNDRLLAVEKKENQ